MENTENKKHREFKLTTASLDNRTTVLLMAVILAIMGITSYKNLPKESFPEVKIPQVFVKTVYPGNPPIDMENLITRPLEKEIHTVTGIKVLSSTSTQDNSDIIIEFNSDVDISDALQDVKDAVDQAKSELPDDLQMDPFVLELDMSEFPILNINLYGDFGIDEIKEYAEQLEDDIEGIPEISKVEIKGLNDREILLNVDPDKMVSYNLGFGDIENAINYENANVSGGDLIVDGTSRSVRTVSEFKTIEEMNNLIVKHEDGDIVYLKDVLVDHKVVDGYADPLSFARLNNKSVVSLQVIKKSGENLLSASDQIMEILADARANNTIPENLHYTVSNDQSENVRSQVSNLENSIYLGVIFVVTVLFFFLGTRNALLVGAAIPMSMLISFAIIGVLGYTINMMILFGLVLALGMLVDNAIVVVENVHRFVSKGYNLYDAIKFAVGEIAWPIIASTATTLAAFLPLAFWPGMMGSFMKLLPITLIIVLTSSLFVALIIIPVFIQTFIKIEKDEKTLKLKNVLILTGIFAAFLGLGYLTGLVWIAHLMMLVIVVTLLNHFFFHRIGILFQTKVLLWIENIYLKVLSWAVEKWRPRIILILSFVLMIVTIGFYFMSDPEIEFFPGNEPQFVNAKVELPVGTDVKATDAFMKEFEADVYTALGADSIYVESILSTVGKGAIGENEFALGNTPQKGITTVTFIDYEDRGDFSTVDKMKEMGDKLIGRYPGAVISVEKNVMGPPVGKPINIEVIGSDFNELMKVSDSVMMFLENQNIAGVEGLKLDIDVGKPELMIEIDREKARRFGLSSLQIASTIRTSLFGKEVSDFKEGEEKYPIRLRYSEKSRKDISSLMNHTITFRNNMGKLLSIPISAVADVNYSSTYGMVKRKDMDRVVTIYSNVLEGYNATEINAQLKVLMEGYSLADGYQYKFTGEQEEMAEAMSFLAKAMLIALGVIVLILVTQFNSGGKPLIIMASVLFSTIGVFGGLATFQMPFVVIMSGIGIISLAGIVVNNAIVLIDYIDLLKTERKLELGLAPDANLDLDDVKDCVINAGKTRLRPVLLTAITTVLGLLPMAIGMNVDFGGYFAELKPDIYVGGQNADFWGPLAWTVIFGLSFATFLTLIVVPMMYLLGNKIKYGVMQLQGKR